MRAPQSTTENGINPLFWQLEKLNNSILQEGQLSICNGQWLKNVDKTKEAQPFKVLAPNEGP